MAEHEKHKDEPDNKKILNNSSPMLFVLILGCFFISGLTGLTYEILWTRMIVRIIGAAPFAVSIVLTVFMGGLGLGSYIAGRTIDRVKDPLRLIRLYGILELAIGAYGVVLPLLLVAFGPLYSVLYNRLFEYFLVYNLLTFAGCSFLLILPVTCMGATLPVLSRFFITSLSRVGTHVGRLYGLNTIGAAAGSLLCGFWLISLWGVPGTLIFAIILNALIGIACLVVSHRLKGKMTAPEETMIGAEAKPSKSHVPVNTHAYGTYALIIFAVSGFCAMACEVIWIKLLGLIVGPTTYSFTIVIVTFISGLALGSIFFGWLGDRIKNVLMLLLLTQVAAALFALLFSQIMGNSQIFFAKVIFHFKDNFAQLYLLKAAMLFLFMSLPTFCLGATFPLVGKVYTNSLAHTGRSIGFAYAVNSVGAVLGSFCAGFLLIPFIGKENSVRLVVAIQVLTALVIGCRIFWKTKKPVLQWAPLALFAFLGLELLYHYPHWDRKMLSTGKYDRFSNATIRNVGWLEALFSGTELFGDFTGRELLYFGDGVGGFTTVLKRDMDILGSVNYSLYNSGKPDASSKGDMHTQTLSAHFPMLFHPNPEKILVIGLASGITAGEILHYPVERLDIVEINEQVVVASDFFLPWNNMVLSNPKTQLVIQDGRAHLELSERKYDVISSEPSNPWMAGLAALFTKDFFGLARDSLNDGGVFVQFIHSYQMDWDTFSLVGRTFSHVFPNSLLVMTDPFLQGPDFLLVGFKGENSLNATIAARNLLYAQRSKNITLLNHKLFYNLIVSEDLERLFGEGQVNTDSRPRLEFSAPKLMHTSDPAIMKKIMADRRHSLSRETTTIMQENLTNIDTQIDFAAYALSIMPAGKPLKIKVDYLDATPEQKRRFSVLMEAYCANNIVTDFSFLKDKDLRKKCVLTQLERVKERVDTLQDDASAYNYIGWFCSENGLFDKAVGHFSEALRIKPDYTDAHNGLGVALANQGKVNEAISHFYAALRINPMCLEAHNNLGLALKRKGEIKDAVVHFREALRIRPGDIQVQNNLENALKLREQATDNCER